MMDRSFNYDHPFRFIEFSCLHLVIINSGGKVFSGYRIVEDTGIILLYPRRISLPKESITVILIKEGFGS